MQTAAEIKEMLAARGLAPRKSLGQNFLIDKNLLAKLVERAGIVPGERVLEVGPGTGTLTETLLDAGARVLAIELDRGLADLLRERLGPRDGFTLIEGDCLASKRRLNDEARAVLGDEPFKLVANLPYGAGTPLLIDLLVRRRTCVGMWATIQREVAERLAAPAGTKAYGPISVIAQLLGRVTVLAKLPPECFWPRPEVTSAFVEVLPRDDAPQIDREGFADAVTRLFTTRRKQLGAVAGKAVCEAAGIDPTQRVEGLVPEEVLSLWRASVAAGGGGAVG